MWGMMQTMAASYNSRCQKPLQTYPAGIAAGQPKFAIIGLFSNDY
jgi:hypothetical protein